MKEIPRFPRDFELIYEWVRAAVEEVDPIGIAEIAEDEYEPENRDITSRLLGRNITSENLFILIRDVFDNWFWKAPENEPLYREITTLIIQEASKQQ